MVISSALFPLIGLAVDAIEHLRAKRPEGVSKTEHSQGKLDAGIDLSQALILGYQETTGKKVVDGVQLAATSMAVREAIASVINARVALMNAEKALATLVNDLKDGAGPAAEPAQP